MPISPVGDPTPGKRKRCSNDRGRRERGSARYRNAIRPLAGRSVSIQ